MFIKVARWNWRDFKNTCKAITLWTQDIYWTYIRRSEDVQDVFWTSYVLCLRNSCKKNWITCNVLNSPFLSGGNKCPKKRLRVEVSNFLWLGEVIIKTLTYNFEWLPCVMKISRTLFFFVISELWIRKVITFQNKSNHLPKKQNFRLCDSISFGF